MLQFGQIKLLQILEVWLDFYWVIMQGVNTEELMKKIGVSTQTVKAGKYKESGTPTRKWFDYEEKQLQSVIDDTYNMFISDVASARNLDVKNHTIFADAKIFTSKQAKM